MAIRVLELLIMQVVSLAKKCAVKADGIPVKSETVPTVRRLDCLKETEEVPEEEILAKPKKSARAAE